MKVFDRSSLMGILSKVLVSGLLVSGFSAEARVFQITKESFAGYLRGSYWSQARKNTLFSDSNSTAAQTITVTNDSFATTMSGEAGFIYASQFLNMKFGFEMLTPAAIKATSATDAAGTELYTADSAVTVSIPKIGFEINYKYFANSRLYLAAAYGAASLSGKNTYTLTASGSAAYAASSIASFAENLSSSAASLEGGLGYEMLFSDTTTFTLEGSYRNLKFTKVRYSSDVTNFQGSVVKDATATNTDGSERVLDLSGPSIVFYLRFYIK